MRLNPVEKYRRSLSTGKVHQYCSSIMGNKESTHFLGSMVSQYSSLSTILLARKSSRACAVPGMSLSASCARYVFGIPTGGEGVGGGAGTAAEAGSQFKGREALCSTLDWVASDVWVEVPSKEGMSKPSRVEVESSVDVGVSMFIR